MYVYAEECEEGILDLLSFVESETDQEKKDLLQYAVAMRHYAKAFAYPKVLIDDDIHEFSDYVVTGSAFTALLTSMIHARRWFCIKRRYEAFTLHFLIQGDDVILMYLNNEAAVFRDIGETFKKDFPGTKFETSTRKKSWKEISFLGNEFSGYGRSRNTERVLSLALLTETEDVTDVELSLQRMKSLYKDSGYDSFLRKVYEHGLKENEMEDEGKYYLLIFINYMYIIHINCQLSVYYRYQLCADLLC
jgi:hypothetical protein